MPGPLFTPYQEFLQNFECLAQETPETRFRDLKMHNNAIMVKIVESEVAFRVLQSTGWADPAMQTSAWGGGAAAGRFFGSKIVEGVGAFSVEALFREGAFSSKHGMYLSIIL